MEEKILHDALANLLKNAGIEAVMHEGENHPDIVLSLAGGKEHFWIEVKREVRNHQMDQIRELAAKHKNLLIIADIIYPKVREALRELGIGYLDTAGNIFVQTKTHHLRIEGNKKDKKPTEKINRAFTATGLKVVYLFLVKENLLNEPHRTIAEEANVALGNINYIFNGLKDQKYLIEKGAKKELINKKQLLERWMVAYADKLKPALHIGNFKFRDTVEMFNWKEKILEKGKTFWGGEPAGDILTQYLTPEVFTIYTNENRNELIKNYQMLPHPDGNVKIYKTFWKEQNTFNETTVHPLLVYCDLMNTGNSRCMETAKMIYERYLKENI